MEYGSPANIYMFKAIETEKVVKDLIVKTPERRD